MPTHSPADCLATVQIRPQNQTFEAVAGLTLLQAAERAGVDLPSSCRNGTCRTCICKVVQGEYEILMEWPGLSAEEKAQGYCLPCVTTARGPLVLEYPHGLE
jgi:ferredoxin